MTTPVPAATPLRIDLTEAFEGGNAVISPVDGYDGVYFTIIGAGSSEEQNALGRRIVAALSAPAPAEPRQDDVDGCGSVCPFCGRDPFEYVDVGVGMVPVAVTCCELGDQYFRGARPAPEQVTLSWDEFTEIGNRLLAPRPARPDAGEAVALLKEPTDEMLNAAVKGTRADISYEDAREIWAAMRKVYPPADSAETARVAEGCHGLDTPERVCFYEQDFYPLSNFSSFRVEWSGFSFDTSEHLYHWLKFSTGEPSDLLIGRDIKNASSAHEAFKIAEANKATRRADWDDVKVGFMRRIIRAKADQHEYVRRKLLATGDRELVENSWRDDFWGWGPNRDGQNMLGKLWMELRAELRAALGAQEVQS